MVQEGAGVVVVVGVVGGQEADPHLLGDGAQAGVAGAVRLQSVVAHLHEVALGAEGVAVAPGHLAGGARPPGAQGAGELAPGAAGEDDQPLPPGGEGVEGDGGPVAPAPAVGLGEQGAEVAVAGEVLGQEDGVGRAGGGVQGQLGADDGLQVAPLRLRGEADDAGDAVVVGDGQGPQPQLGRRAPPSSPGRWCRPGGRSWCGRGARRTRARSRSCPEEPVPESGAGGVGRLAGWAGWGCRGRRGRSVEDSLQEPVV